MRVRLFDLAYGDQALFVRRTVCEELGGYRELPLMEDVDFIRRLRRTATLNMPMCRRSPRRGDGNETVGSGGPSTTPCSLRCFLPGTRPSAWHVVTTAERRLRPCRGPWRGSRAGVACRARGHE